MRLFQPKPRSVAIVGLPGHGKTVFLAGLFWDSFFSLSHSFQDRQSPFAVRAVTEEASRVFYGNALLLRDLRLPPPNPRSLPSPAVLEFQGIPNGRNGRRQAERLVFYDIAGEVFTRDDLTREYAPYLDAAEDIIFLFDPTHPDFSALSAAQLVDRVYRVAGRGRKNLIIALSKMDELRIEDEWAAMIGDCWPDVPPCPTDLPHYFDEMNQLSVSLRGWWTHPRRQGHNLIHGLPAATQFCLLSSLGNAPIHDANGILRLQEKPKPFRVRDPLFWIFRNRGTM